MLDINWVCNNLDLVRLAFQQKLSGSDLAAIGLDEIVKLNSKRKSLQHRSDEVKHQKKLVSSAFQKARRSGEDVVSIEAKSGAFKAEEKALDHELSMVKERLNKLALTLPNIPSPKAPVGGQNVVVREHGERLALGFDAKDHVVLGKSLGILDVQDRGVKVTGSGFALFMGLGARLVRGLINFMLDFHREKHGYTEVAPPFLVNRKTLTGTGQLPKFEEDMYHCERDDLFLISTAEVPVTNLHAGEILDNGQLPLSYCAYTPCFRREAGSYGKMTRGLKRLHQFDKVELVRFCLPEESEKEHERLLGHAEAVLKVLGLHYRVLELATRDMSFAAARCYDLEAWAPVTQEYLEVSSVSNFGDFQARRAGIRFRDERQKVRLVHTLNGSGLALPRVILCLMEHYQQQDGTIRVPEVLQPYLGCDLLKRRW